VDGEVVLAGHDRSAPGAQVPGRGTRPVVQAVQAVDREPLEQRVVEHRLRAAAGLLGRLEDHPDRAVEGAVLRESSGGAQRHRHVPVVAAGVHRPGMCGRVPDAAVLGDRQGVQFAAQPDRRSRSPARQRADDAGAADPRRHLEAERPELGGDVGAGQVLTERRLRDAVQVVPPLTQLCGSGRGGHGSSLGRERRPVHHAGPVLDRPVR
jgi:hypothetical protein